MEAHKHVIEIAKTENKDDNERQKNLRQESGMYSVSKSKFTGVEATFTVPKLPAQKEFAIEKKEVC